jgi:basic membrane protein A and related proteins
MKRVLAIVFTVILLAGIVLSGTGCTSSSDPKSMKVGFIYVGPVGDGGFTYSQDQGRLYLEKTLGVQTMMVESVKENGDCTSAMENLIKKGCKVIFATSYGYMDYVEALAKKYPKVIFEHCSGGKMNTTNFGNYFGREYQARYLAGIAAGKATKTNKIGYVAAMKIPECIRGIDAFTLGVRSVNPNATVNVVWTNTWYDPTIEKNSADSLLAAGCDVMAQHQDTASAVAAAAAAGAYSTGYNTSMAKAGVDKYLTSPIWNWGPYFVTVVDSVLKGTYKPASYWGGLETGTIALDAFGPSVSQETKDAIAAKTAEIESGKWDVFTGPIKDQSGAEKVASGAKMSDGDMLSLTWFVEGVVGSPK